MSAPLTPEQLAMLLELGRVLSASLPPGSEFYLGVACPGMPGVQTVSNIRLVRQPAFLKLLLDSHTSGAAQKLGES